MTPPDEPSTGWLSTLRRRPEIPAALMLMLVAAAFGLPSLDARLNVDGVAYWHGRTVTFWNAVWDSDWEATYQSHPGVTYMWLAGLAEQWFGLFAAKWSPKLVAVLKLPVAILHVFAIGATFSALRRYLGPQKTNIAFAITFLWATEPFVVAHGRSLHLDAMVADLGWLAALGALLALKERDVRWSFGAGVLLGFAVLTKIAAASVAIGIAVAYAVDLARTRDPRSLVSISIIGVTAIVTCFLAWPALLFEPSTTLSRLVEGVSGEMTKGHLAFFMGETSMQPGIGFYPAVLFFRLTPEALLLVAAAVVIAVHLAATRTLGPLSIETKLCLWLCLIYCVFAIAVGRSPKKQDRYIVPLFPVLCTVASVGGFQIWRWLRSGPVARRHQRAIGVALLALFGVLRIGRLADAMPIPLAWCAKWPGLRAEDHIPVGWGEGLREVALWIGADAKRRGVDRPRIHLGKRYFVIFRPWLTFRDGAERDAEYVVWYLGVAQREIGGRQFYAELENREPLFVVELDGRRMAAVYAGPKYR